MADNEQFATTPLPGAPPEARLAAAKLRATTSLQPAIDRSLAIAKAAREYGVSGEVAGASLEAMQADTTGRAQQQQLARSRALTEWILSSDTGGGIARDDLRNLADFDDATKALKRASDRPGLNSFYDATFGNVARGIQKVIDAPGIPEEAFTGQYWRDVASDFTLEHAGRSLAAGVLDLGSSAAGIASAVSDFMPFGQTERLVRRQLGMDDTTASGAFFANLGGALSQWTEANVAPQEFKTSEGAGFFSGVRSLPVTAASLAAAALPGGAATVTLGRLSAPLAALRGAVVAGMATFGQEYTADRELGLTPETAGAHAGVNAVLETVTELPFLSRFLGDLSSGAAFTKRFAHAVVAEGVGEQVATLTQDFSDWAFIERNRGKTFADYLAERPRAAYETAWAVLAMTSTTTLASEAGERIANRFGRSYKGALEAGRTREVLETMQRVASASETLQRDRTTFESFVATAGEDAGVTEVFVNAAELVEAYNQAGLPIERVAEDAGVELGALQTAVAIGSIVSIPIEHYAARISQSEVAASVLDIAKLDPDDMSAAEAREFMQSAEETLAAIMNEETAEAGRRNETLDDIAAVRDAMLDQLQATGRFTKAMNFGQATLFAHVMHNMGAGEGLTARQMAERYQLEIAAEGAPRTKRTYGQGAALPVRVNIGLRTTEVRGEGAPDLTPEEALAALKKAGAEVATYAVLPAGTSGSEPTLSATLAAPLSAEALDQLSLDTHQQAVVQAIGEEGELFGPMADAWAPFDARFFREEDDRTLQEHRAERLLRASTKGFYQQITTNLAGLPDKSPGAFAPARVAAVVYMESTGIPYEPVANYAKVNRQRAEAIAKAYEEMKHDPNDPAVRKSYEALAKETLAQWAVVKNMGLQVEFHDNPYADSPWGAVHDVRDNNHLYVYPTDAGYGQEGITPEELAENPMLAIVPNETWSGRPVRVNDVFRAVHDYFGHIKDGVGFRAGGEENAWRSHAAMFSPVARWALTTETRGQNSWLNYGPHGERNRTAKVGDTVFAPQKIGLLPRWVVEDGRTDAPTTPALASETLEDLKALAAALPKPETVKHYEDLRTYFKGRARVGAGGAVYLLADHPNDLNQWGQKQARERFDGEYVEADDPRWLAAMPLTLERPPINPDGSITLQHYSAAVEKLTTTDPNRWGASGDFLSRAERNTIGTSLPRTYFGIATGVPGGYVNEFASDETNRYFAAGRRLYETRIPADRLYDRDGNPDKVNKGRRMGANEYERAIREAGYAGYWARTDELGLVAVVFDPMEVVAVEQGVTFDQSPVFYSGLARAIGASKTARASAEQWEATLRKTAGVKQEELEWTGVLDFLHGLDGLVSREDLLAFVQNGGVEISETLLEDEEREFAAYSTFGEGDEGYRELQLRLPWWGANAKVAPNAFVGPHWNETNMLAHVRFTEAVDDQGRKTLHIAEIQSDWHQAGRDEGYVSEGGAVADAPFKTTWPALAMKRVIRWAVDNGYEAVSWDTGETQQVRYSLTRVVPSLRARREGDGYAVEAQRGLSVERLVQAGGTRLNSMAVQFTAEGLDRLLGKDVAARLREAADAKAASLDGERGEADPYGEISGDDLRVGGHGMTAFYDRNLVNITNSLVKRHGTRVGPMEVEHPAGGSFAVPALGFTVTPSLAEAAAGGFPMFQPSGMANQERGRISFGRDITKTASVITLLQGADASTFIHETGHFYWEVMTDLASRPGASDAIKRDVAAMLRFVGVPDLNQWARMNTGARRPGHEQIARAFERFIFDGGQPASGDLAEALRNQSRWIRRVYGDVERLNVELTPEVRGVFTRLIASAEAIDAAERQAGRVPYFTERPPTMTVREWREYQELGLQATEAAVLELAGRSLRDMRYAGRSKNRELQRLQRENADQRKLVKEEVTNDLRNTPVYRAINFLRTGKIDGERVDEPFRLNTSEVRGLLSVPPGEKLPPAFNGMTNAKAPPVQMVADMFGYTSPVELVRDIAFASPLAEAIEAETDNRMRERYGEGGGEREIEQNAEAAVHNNVRARFVATELAALRRAAGRREDRQTLLAAARKLARTGVERLRLREATPGRFEAAARRAALAAQKTKGDVAQAAQFKRDELLQTEFARAVREGKDEAEKTRKHFVRLANSKSTRANIDLAFRDQIDQILEVLQLRPISDAEADRRKDLAAWVADMEAQGFEAVIDPDWLQTLRRKAWRDLTIGEVRELADAVANIEYLGRATRQLLKAKDKADLDTAAAELAASIREHATGVIPPEISSPNYAETVARGAKDFLALHRKMANILFDMDGGEYGGRAWERIMRGLNEAGDAETAMKAKAARDVAALFDMLRSDDLHTKREIEGVGALSLETILSVALNMGNEVNRRRLRDGRGWTEDQLQAIVGQLNGRQWDFVERVWTYLDTFWPEIVAKSERVAGVRPKKVEPEPFQVMVDGKLRLLRGGYYPISYDPRASIRASDDLVDEAALRASRGIATQGQTRRGYEKERVATVLNRPIRGDFSAFFSHINEVIHDLTHHEVLIDVNRLMKHPEVERAMRDHYGPEAIQQLRSGVRDIAAGDTPARNAFERGLNYLRTGVSSAAMGFNLWTSGLQAAGLTQSMSRIGTKYVLRGIGELFGDGANVNAKVKWIYEQSPFMAHRSNTLLREVNEIMNRIGPRNPARELVGRLAPSVGDAADTIANSYFLFIAKMQLVADLPTWMGQYIKSTESGEPHDRAVAIADQAVIDSQSSGMNKDLAAIQRGGPLAKLFTNFYSYFSGTYNQIYDRTRQLQRRGVKDLPLFVVDFSLLTFVPASILQLIYGALKHDDEPIAEQLIKANASYLLGTVVGLRELGGFVEGFDYTGPAGLNIFSAVGKFGKQVAQGELDEGLWRSALAASGILLHIPSTQIDRTIRGTAAFAEGDAGPEAIAVGPPFDAN